MLHQGRWVFGAPAQSPGQTYPPEA